LSDYRHQIQRIEIKLQEFLSPEAARDAVLRFYAVARDADSEVRGILRDPEMNRLYVYDGYYFRPKQGPGFHRALDGVHLLELLTESMMDAYFREMRCQDAIARLTWELHRERTLVRIRRMLWQTSRSLSLVSGDLLEEIRRLQETEANSAGAACLLSREEQAFFRNYEVQMLEWRRGGARREKAA